MQSGLFEEFSLLNEKEFRLRIDEPLDQSRAGNPIHLDVFSRNPFHIYLTDARSM